MTEPDLFRQYREQPSEAAFAALVQRYVDQVYSAALRQVSSPDLARDVAQATFLELAANARRLRADTHLGSWLHVVARRRAVDVVRREGRRARIEAAAAAEISVDTNEPVWAEIRPVLDDALASLEEADREAVVRRYFESEGFREIGRALGVSEDTAQKRVTRALERLRMALTRRGVTASAMLIAEVVSARAIEPAPAELAGRIAQAFSAGAVAPVVSTTTHAFGHALWVGYGVAAAAALGYFVHLQRAQAIEIAALRADASRAVGVDTHAAADGAEPDGSSEAPAVVTDPTDAEARVLARRIRRLQDWLLRVPDDGSPEFALLTANDWILAAARAPALDNYDAAPVEQQNAVEGALLALDQAASNHFQPAIGRALTRFREATGRSAPSAVKELAPYFEPPIDPALLRGYTVDQRGTFTYRRFNGSWTFTPAWEGGVAQ